MSKYGDLWTYIQNRNEDELVLTYKEIEDICHIPLDHSFLKYKKELLEYGYQVKKISMKKEQVTFERKPI